MWQQMRNNVHWHAQLYLTAEVLITLQEERHDPVRFFLLVLILEVVVGLRVMRRLYPHYLQQQVMDALRHAAL